MNPLFIATVPAADVARALRLWPELAGRRVRPLLVSALGDVYVETDTGEVLVIDPLDLDCSHAADSVAHLEQLFSEPSWAHEHLVTELLLLAEERGITRGQHQVFAVAPHPSLSGNLGVENLFAMDLPSGITSVRNFVWLDRESAVRLRGMSCFGLGALTASVPVD